MTAEAWFTLVVLLATIMMMVRDFLAPPTAVLGGTIVLLITGIIDAEQAFSGFANPAPITVAALYVLARAVDVTGAINPLVTGLLGNGEASRSIRSLLARLLLPVAGASAFLNNTPIVAMTAPQVATWANQRGRPVSQLLMPLSFAAILGGVITSIGTSTNLVVSGLMTNQGMPPLGLFEITRIGLPVALIGVGVITLLAPILLRPRESPSTDLKEHVREFSVDMRVVESGPLEGRSVEEAGLRHLQGVFLVRIERDGYGIAPVAPTEILRGGDILSFVGKIDLIVDLQRVRGLVSTEQHHLYGIDDTRQAFFEVVLGSESWLVGRTLKEVGFRSRYDAAVLAVHRAGQRVDAKLGELRLRPGDTLLILADDGFRRRWRESGDFLVVAPLGGTPPGRTRHATLVLLIGGLLVGAAGTGLMSILNASLVAAIVLVLTRVLTVREAREAVDLNVIVVIGAAFGIGSAIQTTGLAQAAADLLLGLFQPLGVIGALAGLVIATVLLTEIITNNAAAVLMFPIALATANTIGADPRPFAIAVAVAASASFLTPIGYQTNTIVYGLGGYRFSDYLRLGFPLTVVVVATILIVVPVAWAV